MTTLRKLYLIIANTLVLLVAIVVGAQLCQGLYVEYTNRSAYERLSDVARRNYAHMREGDVRNLLEAFNTLQYRFDPWVGYREDAKTSRFLNVDRHGIRANGPARRDISSLDGAVWFFGGSTAFGYGVADGETIPARLEQAWGKPVTNLGVAGFYSARENMLLNYYLRLGYRPSMAVFLDGINESCDLEDYRTEMTLLFAKAQRRYSLDFLDFFNPLIGVYDALRRRAARFVGAAGVPVYESGLECAMDGKRLALSVLHARFLAERDALCALYRIDCRTIVQPFAGAHGVHADSTLSKDDRRKLQGQFRHLEENWRRSGAVFVTDALDRLPHHAYVDSLHYSAEASDLIARAIAARLK